MESAIEISEAVRRGEVSAREMAERALARIDSADPKLNAFVHIGRDQALAAADRIDAARARGDALGPLAGVPFGVKDMDRCAGMPVSYGSLVHKGGPPATADSIHIGRLRKAGAVPIGMTASSEFGTVHFTRTRAWGITRNPWNLERSSGGSSGGSSAAVSAGLVPFATAGDGGGSTRIPASYTGLLGFKPSYGRIPREQASTSQTAVWGALTTTVSDAARHLDVSAGPDDHDRTSLPAVGVAYEQCAETLPTRGLRAVWSPDLGFARVDPEVLRICEEAAGSLVAAAELELVERPIELSDPIKAWLGAGAIDIWLHLEKGQWPACGEVMVPHVRRIFEQTETLPAPVYARMLQRRLRLEFEVADFFEDVDLLITPTTATPAFAAEGPKQVEIAGERIEPSHTVPFTMLANLCWNPAVSIPAGHSEDGLPIGLQITARRHCDDVVLRLARIMEQARPWPLRAPGWS